MSYRLIKPLLLTALLIPLMPLSGAEFTLESLLQRLAQVRSVNAHFREQKRLAVLDQPLQLSGILRYRAPDYIKRQVVLPTPSSIEIQGERLLINDPQWGEQTLTLDDQPELRALDAALRGLLAGDGDGLRRYFEPALSGQLDDWRLSLVPKPSQPRIAQRIAAIIVSGTGQRITTLETRETDGDSSLMTITTSSLTAQ